MPNPEIPPHESRPDGRPRYTKWFWKDWLVKTRDMSPLAKAAYVDLLGYAVTTQDDFCSIPNDESRLARASGLGLKAWRRVAPEVIARFELTDSGRLRCPRLTEDALKWAQHCANQQSRRTGGQPAVNRDSTGTPPGLHRGTTIRARARSQKSEVDSKEESNTRSKPPRARRSVCPAEPDGFLPFYEAFPKHVARIDAAKAYGKALRGADAATLLAGAVRYRASVADADPQFTQAPAAWLNKGRWMDDLPEAPGKDMWDTPAPPKAGRP